jgi:hypothetical protein
MTELTAFPNPNLRNLKHCVAVLAGNRMTTHGSREQQS